MELLTLPRLPDGPAGLPGAAAIGAGFLAACALSIALSRLGDDIAGIWIGNAFVFAVLLRLPRLATPATFASVFVASMVGNFFGGSSPQAATLFSLTNLLHIWLGLRLVRPRLGETLAHPLDIRGFGTIIGLAGGLATGLVAVAFAALASVQLGWPLFAAAWDWGGANALGFALILPIMLYADRKSLDALRSADRLVRLLANATVCSAGASLALAWGHYPFALAMLPLLVAATQLTVFEMALVCVAVAGAILGTGMTGSLEATGSRLDAFANGFQVAVAVTILTPFLAALFIQQIKADRIRISESEQRFRRAMQDSVIGAVIVGLGGQIIEANRALGAMLGFGLAELERMTLGRISHPDDAPLLADAMRRAELGEARSCLLEMRFLTRDGRAVWGRLSGSVICEQDSGAPMYLVCQIEDIDARKKSEARIAEAETRWNFALASAGQGVWDLDLRQGRVTYSSTWKEMLGYGPDELDGDADQWLRLVHPDDIGRVHLADKDHFAGRTPHFEAEFRMRRKDGKWIWILDRGKVMERDDDGKPLRAIGTLTDITARREAEEWMAESAALLAGEKERLRVTLDSIGDAVICTDASGRITFMNPVAERLTRATRQEAMGQALEAFYAPIDEETGQRVDGAGQGVQHNSRAVLVRRDGSRCSIREVVSPILTERGEAAGSVIVFQDFTDARSLQRELAHAAAHDALTGLSNRTSFLAAMEALSAQPGDHTPHQFLFLDLDHFKGVNDTSGHAAGDALLRQVADTIRRAVRPGDVVARLGGDEFAIVLKRAGRGPALEIAEGLVDAIERIGFEWGGRRHSISVSIGMARLEPGVGIDEVIARADEACYSAKAAGRGCVATFEGEPVPRPAAPARRAAS